MSLTRLCMILAPVALLSGCASSLSKSIEQRLAISEQCRLATSVLPEKFEIPDALLSVQLGNVGKCSLNPDQTLLPMCSIDQIVDKYNLTHVPDDVLPGLAASREGHKARRAALVVAVTGLRQDLESLASTVRGIDQAIKLRNEELRKADAEARARAASAKTGTDKTAPSALPAPPRYHADTAWLQAMHAKSSEVNNSLRQVRKRQHQVRLAVQALAMELEPAARIELEAWDANLRIHLTRFEEALSGSQALAVREGVKDLVLTHVARRTLEMLHNSLKTADAVLRELDDKAYGAVSMGYLVLGPDLQTAVNAAFDNIKAAAKARETQRRQDQERADQEAGLRAGLSSTAPAHDPAADVLLSKPVLRELRRAACENLVQGTQFSMLTELIDTMIILQIEKEDAILAQVDPPQADNPRKAERFPEDRTHTYGRANEPEEISPFTAYAGDTSLAAAETDEQDRTGTMSAHLVTPAGVHMANTWAARQQLLTQAIAAKAQGGAGSDSAGQPVSGVDLIDETTVQRLADVATAKAIDDAVRLSPATVNMRGAQVSDKISSNVAVVTAATAVSQASVTLKLNLSVSNVNNFTPTNYNNVTPVINLAVPSSPGAASGPSAALPSLCADLALARGGADCTRTADGYVISFARRSFRSDSCLASDLEPALTALGRGLAAYRARNGLEHKAAIQGHASARPAALAGCKAAASPAYACKYVNKLRETVQVSDCDPAAVDRNVVLSAARATHAARVLETAARGALVVEKLVAKGAQSAQPGGAAALDQTILIHLSPLRTN